MTQDAINALALQVIRHIITLGDVCRQYGDDIGEMVYKATISYSWDTRTKWVRRVR